MKYIIRFCVNTKLPYNQRADRAYQGVLLYSRSRLEDLYLYILTYSTTVITIKLQISEKVERLRMLKYHLLT